jgi:hypothetical protein
MSVTSPPSPTNNHLVKRSTVSSITLSPVCTSYETYVPNHPRRTLPFAEIEDVQFVAAHVTLGTASSSSAFIITAQTMYVPRGNSNRAVFFLNMSNE